MILKRWGQSICIHQPGNKQIILDLPADTVLELRENDELWVKLMPMETTPGPTSDSTQAETECIQIVEPTRQNNEWFGKVMATLDQLLYGKHDGCKPMFFMDYNLRVTIAATRKSPCYKMDKVDLSDNLMLPFIKKDGILFMEQKSLHLLPKSDNISITFPDDEDGIVLIISAKNRLYKKYYFFNLYSFYKSDLYYMYELCKHDPNDTCRDIWVQGVKQNDDVSNYVLPTTARPLAQPGGGKVIKSR